MRTLAITAAVLGLAGAARADDAIAVGAAIGAGGQGDATYGAIGLSLDAEWHGARLGLGGRGVWLDGAWRARDWARPLDAVRALRWFELAGTPGEVQLALAAGGLAPAQLAHVADGHRAGLDDRARTGTRAALAARTLAAGLEIDDVLDPSLVGGALAWQLAEPWGVIAATAVDPERSLATIELAGAYRVQREGWRVESGAGVVAEPDLGTSAIAFASALADGAGARWSASAELRAGTGTVGGAFGPLHRLERGSHEGDAGIGGALAVGVAADAGWVRAGVRARPRLGTLGTLSAGAPMGRWLQAAGWIAASPRAIAGAAEVRVAWARRLASALELARMYDTDAMDPTPAWSLTAWFAVASH